MMILQKCMQILFLILVQDVYPICAYPNPDVLNTDTDPYRQNELPDDDVKFQQPLKKYIPSPNNLKEKGLDESVDTERLIVKRSANSNKHWPNNIPYVIDSTYTGNVDRFRRALLYIQKRLCVTFHEIPNIDTANNQEWYTKHGYNSSAFVKVISKIGCTAQMGQGRGKGPMRVAPCNDFRTYIENTSPQVVSKYYDDNSALMYADWTWNSNGLETYTRIRDDNTFSDKQGAHDNVIFLELNKVYKCNERFCNDDQKDCSPGYHSLINGICRCVCPDDLDPSTNCKKPINKAASFVNWPKTQIVLYGANGCPDEFDQNVGVLPITGSSELHQDPVPILIPSKKSTLELPICTKTTPANKADIDWHSWPAGGRYCIPKSKGVNCGGAFHESSLELSTTDASSPVGNVGDTEIKGKEVTMKFCCQKDDKSDMPLDLPNDHAFRFLSNRGDCPIVTGMTGIGGYVDFFPIKAAASGSLPEHTVSGGSHVELHQCLYIPPVYGCNIVTTFNAATTSVRITTPGFGVAREPNRRCFYAFNNPDNSKLMLTFNKYNPNEHDKLFIKRFHKWQDVRRVKNSKVPYQIVTAGNYLSLEYWSSWETVQEMGIDMTVKVLLGEDFCYNFSANGEDYKGDKSVTETYEQCVPWTKAVTCEDFPFEDLSLLTSGNKCRNPSGALDQPWCYTFVNGTECHKRFCDVCNFKTPVDSLDNCTAFIDADPTFCATALQRFGCFKSCSLPLETFTPTTNGCPFQWTKYGERCFKVFNLELNNEEAIESCHSFGSSGTLFQSRSRDDELQIRRFMAETLKSKHIAVWISGKFESVTKKWFFIDEDVPMSYLAFSKRSEEKPNSNQCILETGEIDSRKWNWKLVSCDGLETASYICQLDNSLSALKKIVVADRPCQEDRLLCERVLAAFPTFCSDGRSVNVSSQRCSRSCGKCSDNIPCIEPQHDSTYYRTSGQSVIESGQVMSFTCKKGLYHLGGHLQRACSSTGRLLGREPRCSGEPVSRDVKLETVRKRHSNLPSNTAILLDHDEYRIPFNGKITRWYYYCHQTGTLEFIVYRRDGETYKYVGSNTATCLPKWKTSFNVPASDQISVNEGDVFGVYSESSNTLAINDCNKAQDRILVLPSTEANSFKELIKSSNKFSVPDCLIPSLGLRLEP